MDGAGKDWRDGIEVGSWQPRLLGHRLIFCLLLSQHLLLFPGWYTGQCCTQSWHWELNWGKGMGRGWRGPWRSEEDGLREGVCSRREEIGWQWKVLCQTVPMVLWCPTHWLPDGKGEVVGLGSDSLGLGFCCEFFRHLTSLQPSPPPLFSHFLATQALSLSDRVLGEPWPPPCCLWDACAPPSPRRVTKPQAAADRGIPA